MTQTFALRFATTIALVRKLRLPDTSWCRALFAGGAAGEFENARRRYDTGEDDVRPSRGAFRRGGGRSEFQAMLERRI